MPVVGSRFLIEAGFIIAVAVIAGVEQLSTWWIIAVVASAWIIVAIVEIVVWARQADVRRDSAVESSEPFEAFEPQAEEPTFVAPVSVRVQPTVESRREPESEPTGRARRARAVAHRAAVPSPPQSGKPELESEPVPPCCRLHSANEGQECLWELNGRHGITPPTMSCVTKSARIS